MKLEGKNIKTEEKVGQVFVSGGEDPVQVTIIHLALKKYSWWEWQACREWAVNTNGSSYSIPSWYTYTERSS